MRRSYYIAKAVFLESLKNYTLVSMVVFGVIVLLASLFLNNAMLGEYGKLVVDLELTLPILIGLIIIIFNGTRLVYDEIEKKTIYIYASKPIKRWEFILGKFLGLTAVFLIVTVAFAVLGFLFLMLLHIPVKGQYVLSLFFSLLELMILLSVTMFFSSFSATPILTGVFAFVIYFAGHLAPDIYQYSLMAKNQMVRVMVRIIYYVLPNLSYYNITKEVTHNIPISASQIYYVISYALLYIVLMMVFSILIFEKKEF